MTIERADALSGEEAPDAMPYWLIQWPMMAFTGWWDVVFNAWQPAHGPHHAGERHDLTVPDPIEREGEHALFA